MMCEWLTVMYIQCVVNDLKVLAKEAHLQHVVYKLH